MSGSVTVLPLKEIVMAVEATPTPSPTTPADLTGLISSNPSVAGVVGIAIVLLVVGAFLFLRKR